MKRAGLFLPILILFLALSPALARGEMEGQTEGEPVDRAARWRHRAMDEEADRWNRRRDEAVEAEVMRLMTRRKQAIEEAAGGLAGGEGKERFFFTRNHVSVRVPPPPLTLRLPR